jgi:hypothetical protein
VFIDWSQNSRHKTTVAVYSLRARPHPMVSTPVTWEEVEEAADGADLSFEAPDVLARVQEYGDLFADTLTIEQHLPRRPADAGVAEPMATGRGRRPVAGAPHGPWRSRHGWPSHLDGGCAGGRRATGRVSPSGHTDADAAQGRMTPCRARWFSLPSSSSS